MATGVQPDGTYQYTVPGITPIVQNAIPSYTLTGSTGQSIMTSINIPPLQQYGFGPDSELVINVTWTCNSSANTKTLTASFGSIVNSVVPWTDVQTTNTTNEWSFRVSCKNNTAIQVVAAGPVLGGSANALQTMTRDFTTENYLTLYGTLANAADSMTVARYSVYLVNSPVYTSPRALYGQKVFWGGNCHFDDMSGFGGSVTTAQLVSNLQALGMTTVRATYEGPTSLPSLVNIANALRGTGIQMYCCIDVDTTSNGSTFWPTEQAAYNNAYAIARNVALTLQPLGVTMFEAGNELDTKHGINTVGDQGSATASFSNSQWPVFRGTIAGALDGIKSVPGTLSASNAFTLCGIGASDGLWNGTAPDGSSGYRQLRWDITAWHNYSPYGSLMCISRSFQKPNMNLLEYVSRKYQRPIMISEFSGASGNTEAQQLAWWTYLASDYYANRYKYNIMGCMTYQLYQGFPPWALVQTPSTNTLYATFGVGVKNFIAANADTGT